MRISVCSLALVVVSLFAVTARADTEFGEYDKESYPKALVQRPLLLAASMFEVRFGASADFVSSESADRLDAKMDFIYGLATRFQLGFEADLAAVPTDDFAVNGISLWGEYNFVPNASGRAGVFFAAPRDAAGDLDSQVGFLFGVPIKFLLGAKAAAVGNPQVTFVDGDSLIEVPVGIQYQLVSAFALTARTGLETVNFEFGDGMWRMPLAAGAVLHFTRNIDFTAEFLFPDVANDSDSRWVMGYFSFRG